MRRYSFSSTATRSRNNESKDTVIQALLYSSAFVLTFIFPVIAWSCRNTQGSLFIIDLLVKTFYPLQGFWNFIFYIRPGVNEARRANPHKSLIKILREVVFHAKDRNRRVRQTRTNRGDIQGVDIALRLALPTTSSHEHSPEIESDLDTDIKQSKYVKCVETDHDVIPGVLRVGVEDNPHDVDNRPHNSGQASIPLIALEDGHNVPIGNESPLQICVSGKQVIQLNEGSTINNDVHAGNSTSALDADNLPRISSLYMEDKCLDTKMSKNHKAQSLNSIDSLGQRPLGIQWDDSRVPEICHSCTESKAESKSIANLTCPLGNAGEGDGRAPRRTSLINLATISSLYELDYDDSSEDV
eukprot:CAMPEP_0198255778 /NCGR_PEP_ID=MMETSP1447-20131203/5833_1 /TAXON_ID=420782 /ORGANISM="Chaetoceros dichaeta, Strain CCMP1751" /LENGTH=355 /DNA_ID=CAMNT_0043942235 /DNA_START=532 /DNA_END=1599 /DNA_ORIENTATION=+